jgi:hypothetical protein
MSTRRAKQHKGRTHIGRLVREHVNETNRGGLFDKRLNKVTCRPYKFRKRAYYRENDLEGKILEKKLQQSLKTDPLGLLQVKPADWQHSEKMLQTNNNRSQKTRHINIRSALAAEPAYEWRKQYQYSQIAENLYKTGPVSIDFTANPELVKKLWEALKDD